MKKRIVVLMSTYNGEKYIREQLDSILNQIDVELKVLIRDDGSSDSTVNIIEEYENKYANVVLINKNCIDNIGFNKSFLMLMSYGLECEPEVEYFSFADQDDVWDSDKLISALKEIEKHLSNKEDGRIRPIYYFANKNWTDEQLKVLHQDDMRYCKNDYFDMFMLPPVYGCTSVFNRELGIKTLEKEFSDDLLYDVYMYRLTCVMEGILISDSHTCMKYRRHGNNASGDAMKFSLFKYAKKIFKRNQKSFHGMRNYVSVLYKLYMDNMTEETRTLCNLVLTYETSIKSRMRLIFWKRAHQRGAKASIMWIGRVIFNAI